MGEFLETIYDVMFKPKDAFQRFAQTPQVKEACLVVLITTILSAVAISAGTMQIGEYRGGLIAVQLIGNFITLFVTVAIWHLIAELMSGQGQVKSLLTVVGFSCFPQLLLVPIYLIASFLAVDMANMLILIASFAVLIWIMYLIFNGIKIVYQVSGSKAFLVIIMPMLTMLVLMVVTFIMIGTMFMSVFDGAIPMPPTL